MKYFILVGKDQKGPFDIDELKSQKIMPTTQVWKEGMESWTTANAFPELSFLFITPPPPPITPPQPLSSIINKQEAYNKTNQKKSLGNRILIGLGILVLGLIAFSIFKQMQHNNQVQQEQAEKDRIKNNIRSYVVANRSGYTYSELGGISGLSITVVNGTPYILDNVRIKVDYIKTDGEIYTSNYLDFAYVPASGSLTLNAPDSERGTSVQYSIISIKSTSLGLY